MLELILPDKYMEQEELQWFIDLNLAFLQERWDVIDQHLSDDVSWHIIGDRKLSGKDEFLQFLKGMESPNAKSLTFDNIWVEGPEIISRGSVQLETSEAVGFADFYIFEDKKIKRLTSYVIKLQ